MYKSDIKIIELIEMLKSLGVIEYDYEFCERIGFLKQNLIRVKQGLAHFTAEHIGIICSVYKVNANWIFGSEKNVFRLEKTPVYNEKSNFLPLTK